jgi:hypothetical protein
VALLVALLALRAPGATAEDGASYQNPVHAEDFADPFVLRSGSLWFAFSTHRGLANIQIFSSADLEHWQSVGTALPFLPGWAEGPWVWAPAVLARSGHHVLYYSVRERATGKFCVTAATSTTGPQGPYFDGSSGPLVCQRDRGGTIDPSVFTEPDGRAFLLYKSEGIAGREPTRLWSAPLDDAGLRLAGWPVELLHTEQPWEQPIIENPAMARGDGRYFLLYSASDWSTARYATGYAVCDSPMGPCRRPAHGPVLASANGATGPGGADFFTDTDGGLWIAYHAWTGSRVGYQSGGSRSLRIDRVTFARGRPWIDGPSTGVRLFAHRPVPPPLRVAPVRPAPLTAAAAPRPEPSAAAPPMTTTTALEAAPTSTLAPVPSARAVRPVEVLDRAGGAAVVAPSVRVASPSRRGPVALAALLVVAVGAAGARQLERPDRTHSLRARRAPCPSARGR